MRRTLTSTAVLGKAVHFPLVAQWTSSQHVAVARLFTGSAQVELREHFAGEAVLAGLVGDNAANLQDSITGETYEHTTMYPGFAAQAAHS